MKLHFAITFYTQPGEDLQLVVTENKKTRYYNMSYTSSGVWMIEFDYFSRKIDYKFRVVDQNLLVLHEEIIGHSLSLPYNYQDFLVYDEWNLRSFPENFLNTKVLENYWKNFIAERISIVKQHSHLFRVEIPLFNENWKVVLVGNPAELGNWDYNKALEMKQTEIGVWELPIEVNEDAQFEYKYGIYDAEKNIVLALENGENRIAFPNLDQELLQIVSSHNAIFDEKFLFKTAGVAVPIFSLKSKKSFGVGEFLDLKLLTDWCVKSGMTVIQTLPINDTTTNYTWTDSYPYSAISVDALHPIYLSFESLKFPIPNHLKNEFDNDKEQLNFSKNLNYETVLHGKWKVIKAVFTENYYEILKDKAFKKFIKENERWLLPYSVFCVLRDQYQTANFNDWKTHKRFILGRIKPFFTKPHKDFSKAMLHAWVQFQLHVQLSEAVDYAHSKGVSLKGDLPIGISRFSVEAWVEPHLFNFDCQTGAPPDFYSSEGQNWGFPTYNWEEMAKEGFTWWKNRFYTLEKYFDALRIDHILGFFRIWRIPTSAISGALGYFHPAIPLRYQDFIDKNVDFDFVRYCEPFINEDLLWKSFENNVSWIKETFFVSKGNGNYTFKEEINNQRKLKDYCSTHKIEDEITQKLLDIASNVLFVVENIKGENVFHPRFNNHLTESFHYLSAQEKQNVYAISQDYFFKRQKVLWRENGYRQLSEVIKGSKMLICGEDLGFVPDCVPEVMKELSILSLKVETMSYQDQPYFSPSNVQYKDVLTTSTHDSETLRQWWVNGKGVNEFYHQQLGISGNPPAEISQQGVKEVLQQCFQSKAMLVILPIQDIFAMHPLSNSYDFTDERINNPAVFPHYWRYRIPFNLEDLKTNEVFNSDLKSMIESACR